MNERVLQFRIGMFVIVAGLVLTMLVVWFGESPALFRDVTYLTVHFDEAPGIAVGIPVRKSGIRVGEVAEIEFDTRPDQGDGVLITLALERKYRFTAGTTPRLARALIGDVSIDLLPGKGPGDLLTSSTPMEAKLPERIVNGRVTPDPADALALAARAFEQVGPTLESIDAAAKGIASLSQETGELDELIASLRDASGKVSALAENADRIVRESGHEVGPTLTGLREAVTKFNSAFDEPTIKNVQTTARNLSQGSARLDKVLADLAPLAAELGAPAGATPTTAGGQLLMRLNRISFDIGLLTAQLADPTGRRLNPNGSLQKLIMRPDLYDNLNRASVSVQDVFNAARPVMRDLSEFAQRIARDPGAISRGVLSRD